MKRHPHTPFLIPGMLYRIAILCLLFTLMIGTRSHILDDTKDSINLPSRSSLTSASASRASTSVPSLPLTNASSSASDNTIGGLGLNVTSASNGTGLNTTAAADCANVSVSKPCRDCSTNPIVRPKSACASVSPDVWKTLRHGANPSIRVRKEVSDLTKDELSRFINAIKKLHSGPGPTAYDEFVYIHMNATYFAHGSDTFFPWHREFLWRFEESLRLIDPTVVLPYWDWSLIQHPEQSIIFTPEFFGGTGDAKQGHCVVDGQIAGWSVHYPSPHCLKRQFEGGSVMAPYCCRELLDSIIQKSEDFTCLRQQIDIPHGRVHVSVAGPNLLGDMGQMYSPNDPVFWLHHAFIDKIYWEYQNKGEKYKNGFSAPELDLCPFGVPAKSVFCTKGLGYTYQEPLSVKVIHEYIANSTARGNATTTRSASSPSSGSASTGSSVATTTSSAVPSSSMTSGSATPSSSVSPVPGATPSASASSLSLTASMNGTHTATSGSSSSSGPTSSSGESSASHATADSHDGCHFLDCCLVDLSTGMVEDVDRAPVFKSTFSLDVQWNEPLDTLAMKVEAMARSENVSRIDTPSPFSRNNTLFLQQSVGLPLAWIQSNSMHEARVRLSEQIVQSLVSIMNVETTRGKFLSLSNPVLHKQMVHRNPDLARFLPEAMDEEIFVTVNRTRVVMANTSAVVVVNETEQTCRHVSVPVLVPDPLANWTCSNFSALPCEQIKEILQSDNVTAALLNVTSSLMHSSTAHLARTSSSTAPISTSSVSPTSTSLSSPTSSSRVMSTSTSAKASPSVAPKPSPPAPKPKPTHTSSASPAYGGGGGGERGGRGDYRPPPPVYHY